MIISENSVALLEQADRLADAFAASAVFAAYQKQTQILAKDQAAQRQIATLQTLKTDYQQIKSYGYYAPGYRQLKHKLQQKTREVMLLPSVAAFKRAEMDLQTVLDEMSVQLASCVSPDVKVATGNPFYLTDRTKSDCISRSE